MTNIDSTRRFLLGLQQQLAASARPGPATKPAPKHTRAEKKTGGAAVRSGQELILERIRAIRDDDPQGRRKAFRVYLESVLADELGTELLTDPAYHRIVDQVHAAMMGDSTVAASIDQAGDYLLQASRRR